MAGKKRTNKRKEVSFISFDYEDKNNKKKKIKLSKKQTLIALLIIVIMIFMTGVTYLIKPSYVTGFFNLIFNNEDNNDDTDNTEYPVSENYFEGINTSLYNDFKNRIYNSSFNDDKAVIEPTVNESLEVHFIDVGQGDCILINFPDGKNMLIDGGDKGNSIYSSIDTYLDNENIDMIDYLMLTHTDSDHVGSLNDVIDNFDVKNVFMPMLYGSYNPEIDNEDDILGSVSTLAYKDFYQSVLNEEYSENNISYDAKVIFNVGILYIVGEDYKMTIYCPDKEYYNNLCSNVGNNNIDGIKAEDINNMSPICVLEYADRRIVLTGDSDELAEDRFMSLTNNTPIDCDVLKVGHHGSSGSSNQEFLDYIDVEYSVISVGASNTYGHPTNATLNRLIGTTIYRTDYNGNILLTIKGSGTINFIHSK